MHLRTLLRLRWLASALLAGAAASAQAQAPGVWDLRGNSGESCNIVTGYAPAEGSSGRHGLRLLVGRDDPDYVLLVITLTADEVRNLALPPLDTVVNVHLTFFNPDLGNAGVNLGMTVSKDEDPSGPRNLVAAIGATELKFLRQYRTLDVYLSDTNTRIQRVSLVNSGAALDRFNRCINTTLRRR